MSTSGFGRLSYETRAIIAKLDDLINKLTGGITGTHQTTISKASTFTNTEVDIAGWNLVQISCDGNLGDITYTIKTSGGATIVEAMNAAETPHWVGVAQSIYVTNSTAEATRNVRVTKYLLPWLALAAIKHGTAERTTTNVGGIIEKANRAPTVRGQALDWFASNITPTRTPSMHRLQIKMVNSANPIVNLQFDDSDNSITNIPLRLNAGTALTTTAVYIFDIMLSRASQSYNLQQETVTSTSMCIITEYPSFTA